MGYEAVDRHAADERRDATALRFVDRAGGATDVTYADLYARTSRFANLLDAPGASLI